MKSCWLRFVDAELNDRDICLWKDMLQHSPGSVVKSPGFVKSCHHRRKQISDSPGKFGTAGCRIFHLVKLSRKAAKIVDSARFRIGCYCTGRYVSVSRHCKHGMGRGIDLPMEAQPSA